MNNENLVKLFFEWTDPDRGLVTESVWAEGLDLNTFRIDNVPFFTYGISYDDVVSAEIKDNNFYFSKLIKRGRHSTLRVFFLEKNDSEQEALFKELNLLGATVERASDQLIAIDVPPNTDIKPIIESLQSGESNGIWSYEEGYIYK